MVKNVAKKTNLVLTIWTKFDIMSRLSVRAGKKRKETERILKKSEKSS